MRHLLVRPNTTIIATSRRRSDALSTLQATTEASQATTPNTRLILRILDVTAPADKYGELVIDLEVNHGISHIDVAIANAGAAPAFDAMFETSTKDMLFAFETNALGPLKLLQSLLNILVPSSSSPSKGKFILISSILGSISSMDNEPNGAYGVSKAAANFIVRKVHLEEEDIVVLALHPGWVATDMGRAFQAVLEEYRGFEGDIPVGVEESVRGMVEVVSYSFALIPGSWEIMTVLNSR